MRKSFQIMGMFFIALTMTLVSCTSEEPIETQETFEFESKASDPLYDVITIQYHRGKTEAEKEEIRTYYTTVKTLKGWEPCPEKPDREIWYVNRDSDVPVRTDPCESKDECDIQKRVEGIDCEFE